VCNICKKEHRPLYVIATDINKAWAKINYAAVPYLEAMENMTCPTAKYWFDDGKSIIMYFLSNASSFRGEKAKALKAELKEMLK